MYDLPVTSIPGEAGFQPPDTGICGRCGGIGVIISRRLNTLYEDMQSNKMVSCELCFEEVWDMYEDQWKEYYAGRL